ncbi:MAG: mannose-6-phosphate isomerase, class I [Leucobacter sp.]
MLIFIENTPRTYSWGSKEALPDMLGTAPNGEPQAELWLGAHPGGPATVAKAIAERCTLIDLIESDPALYGVDGGQLPFLLKVLAIGAPLSLQAHPDLRQAREGFAREEAAGVPRDARDRNYGDPNHKPELLVALSEVTALSGFRPLAEARVDLLGLARLAQLSGDDTGFAALRFAADRLTGDEAEALRSAFLTWAFSAEPEVSRALEAMQRLTNSAALTQDPSPVENPSSDRREALRALITEHPGDPGVLVSLLLHHVRLDPGEAVYLGARQLHAYLSGIAVEVMAASDNVLRAGLTQKHVDVAELCRVLDYDELAEPRFLSTATAPGLVAWRPGIPDFQLLRARLEDPESTRPGRALPGAARVVTIDAEHPLVLIVTAGRVRIERPEAEFDEVAAARRGQSLYISAGPPIRLTGDGEVFLATVGSAGSVDGGAGVSADASAGASPSPIGII